MKNIVRLTAGVNRVNVGNPQDCLEEILVLLQENPHQDSDIILFPRLALTSPSGGGLFANELLQQESEKALNSLREYSHKSDAYIIVGLAIGDMGRPVSAVAVLHKGSVVSYLPANEDFFPQLITTGLSEEFCPQDSVFGCGDVRIGLHLKGLSDLAAGAVAAAENHCDLLLVPLYEPIVAGQIKEITALAGELSRSLGIAVAIVNGGIGDTSSPHMFNGFVAVFEAGEELSARGNQSASFSTTVDIDLDILRGGRSRRSRKTPSQLLYHIPIGEKKGLLRRIRKNPFLPVKSWEKEEYMAELFAYQIKSLAARMANTGIQNLVIGVSGGIDSTSALMVAVATCDYLELPHENIHGITLPGLGTSNHTYYNALALLEQLGVSRRDISIRPAVLQHFQDIGHTGNTDTAYENAQARERTQILLDLGNMLNALIVGTGDLSEVALGFATFGGDHLSSYNVNACMTKTMLREQLKYIIGTGRYQESEETIKDVLETPVSPELLPPSDTGEIVQKTEEILGPYDLHEFFLYYFIAYNMKPSKIYEYACKVFLDSMSAYFIKEKLALFIRKFCANQFKRSCSPDAASITRINLLGINYQIPSDLDPSALLRDLDNID